MKIFYSWQSDLEKEITSNAIRFAIKTAIPLIEQEYGEVSIIFDEATRGEAGSPHIPETIFSKIKNSDVFICDITHIVELQIKESVNKKIPNPNVLIELGYAISILGWERIIMLYNKNYGDISFGIPFDLDKRRITTFQVNDKNDKSGLGNLRTNIQNAINIIIASNPRKEISRSKLSDAEIKRNKDILVLVELLSTISLPIFDIFLLRAPRIIESRILHFWESFNGVYKSSHFHIYNKELIKILNDFHDLWDKSLTYGNYYKSNAGILKFGINNSDEEFEKLAELEQLIKLLSEKKKEFLNYIQEHYLEIDLRVTSENAAKEYNSFNGLG